MTLGDVPDELDTVTTRARRDLAERADLTLVGRPHELDADRHALLAGTAQPYQAKGMALRDPVVIVPSIPAEQSEAVERGGVLVVKVPSDLA